MEKPGGMERARGASFFRGQNVVRVRDTRLGRLRHAGHCRRRSVRNFQQPDGQNEVLNLRKLHSVNIRYQNHQLNWWYAQALKGHITGAAS